MAERLGLPLMPWQRMIADIGGELDPDTGLPAYREVIVTVPRQSGKTTLVLSWQVQRALGWDSTQRIVYSAQSGNDARKKLIEDQVPILEPRRRQLGIRRILRGMGNEAVEFANGSRIVLLAGTAESGHGKTVDLGIKDEFFADWDDRRDQALVPAMMTRAAAQVLTTSTMGTDESVPLNRAVDRGRLAVDSDLRSGIAYFEWSAGPADDPDDPATWWGCMPAMGYTVTEAVVAHARSTLTDGEFRRAFLNQQTKADDRVIPALAWDGVNDEKVAPDAPLTFSLDMNPERAAGAIVAASGTVAELVEYRSSIGWMVGRAVELDQRHGPALWVVDAGGPAASLIPDLTAAGLRVHAASARELIDACGRFYDGVMERSIRIRRHAKLDDAAAGAAKRSIGDSWAFTRKNASTDVCPLVAATLALWGAGQAADVDVAANVW
ncbi:MAG TPA: terminase family protein [Acidimicrobiales bacterium]|nr:terminase family protein [Acidimicrobiales bacterium]